MSHTQDLRSAIAALDDTDVMAMVGPATWGTGLTYYRTGRVIEHQDTEDGRIRGRVKGSGVTYTTWLASETPRPKLTCACTMGSDCVHGVALLLMIREAEREAAAAVAQDAGWRKILTDLVGTPSGAQGEPMALLFDTHDPSEPTWITPMRPGRSVVWTTKRASWPDVTSTQWESVVEGLNPTHVALLREGYRLSREGVRWRSRGEVCLQDLGEQAWTWLRQVERAGVTLLTSLEPRSELHLQPHAWDLGVDASLDEEYLHLLPVAVHGQAIQPNPRIDRATGILFLDGGDVLAQVTSTATLDLLGAQGVSVPRSDLAEFRSTWLRRLRTHLYVTSTDGSYDPNVEATRLVSTLRLAEDGTLVVRWWVEEDSAGVALRAPLGDLMEEGAVRALARRIQELGVSRCPVDLWPMVAGRSGPSTLRLPGWQIPRYLDEVVAKVQDEDLEWDIAPEVLGVEVAEDGVDIHLEVTESDQRDWFDLRVRLLLSGREVEMADVLRALATGQDHILVDGVWVSLHDPRLHRLRTLLAEAAILTGSDVARPRISAWQHGLWGDIDSLVDRVHASDTWRRKLEAIEGAEDEAALPLPSSCQVTLRPYQVDGHSWITTRAVLGLGGILADDMGLGKTVQILSAIQSLREHSRSEGQEPPPVLVVAPTSVLGTWKEEARRFFPDMVVEVAASTRRRRDDGARARMDEADVVVTSYTVVRLEVEEWSGRKLSGLVLDEAQAVKNPATAIHRALRQIEVPWCFAVTGTPVENSLSDLWSVLKLTSPGLMPSWKVFNETLRKPVESGSPQALANLHRLISPFILRRTKNEVAADLPDKIVQVVEIDLGEEHRHIYEQYLTRERTRILGLMQDFGKNRMDVLASLTRLRLLALDPALVDSVHAHVGSAKIEYLADQLDQLVPRGHKVLVFSQFTSFLARIRVVLERRGHEVVQLDGSTRNRADIIESFRAGAAPIFLISLKAGGTGLTLTEADYVFLMDPWWNPAAEAQAVDRAHRIGQTKKVNVYRLAASDTIEEKVLALQEKKRQLVSAVVDGGGSGERISVADLLVLLDD